MIAAAGGDCSARAGGLGAEGGQWGRQGAPTQGKQGRDSGSDHGQPRPRADPQGWGWDKVDSGGRVGGSGSARCMVGHRRTYGIARASVRDRDLSSHAAPAEGGVAPTRLLTALSHMGLIQGYAAAPSPTWPWTQAAKSLGQREQKCLQSFLLPNNRPVYFRVGYWVTWWQFCLLAPNPKSEIVTYISVVLGLLLIGLFICVCLSAALCNTP